MTEAKTPTVLWAQRPDVVYLTVEVPEVEKDSAVVKVRRLDRGSGDAGGNGGICASGNYRCSWSS